MRLKRFNESSNNIVPVITKENSVYYVNDSDITEFIEKNSEIILGSEIYDAVDFCRDNNITSDDGGNSYWEKSDLYKDNAEDNFSEDCIKVMRAWFEVHPFMERIMICFY